MRGICVNSDRSDFLSVSRNCPEKDLSPPTTQVNNSATVKQLEVVKKLCCAGFRQWCVPYHGGVSRLSEVFLFHGNRSGVKVVNLMLILGEKRGFDKARNA